MRLIRTVIAALLAAALGAVAGRIVASMRREATGGDPFTLDAESLAPSPQELVPGLVAALRVQDQPWAALHIPPWLAALVVNFALAALGRELGPLFRAFGLGGDDEERDRTRDIWTVEADTSPASASAAPAAGNGAAARQDGESPQHPGFRPFAT